MKKIFVIPFAGGSSYSFTKWISYNFLNCEILLLDTPGKGKRIKEKLPEDFMDVVWDVYYQINDFMKYQENMEYVIFGHSMGSYIAYEVCKLMEKTHCSLPEYLILSGTIAPDRIDFDIIEEILQDEERFFKYINNFGMIGNEIITNSMMKKFFMPIIECDYALIYQYKNLIEKTRIKTKSIILNGVDDNGEIEDVYAWQDYFTLKPMNKFFLGRHFFILDDDSVVKYLDEIEMKN